MDMYCRQALKQEGVYCAVAYLYLLQYIFEAYP
jgi:hypothetical protein